ncbi:MAG: DNA-directed RNA polymerase subunit alpha [Synergistaceae bacterium]|nr:DNA-directed RNA polymerase subunit alpha [Synergistota bacterium]NLM71949.1 DNA-directed RNA polymerase subunit alpha [Synergistaceae bacterium]
MENLRPEISFEESGPTFARVHMEPLERGYGATLGNAMRRVLLSSIRGAAITSVRIDGVLHEFSTLPGVLEDVIEILLNLKRIPIRSFSKEVRMLRLEKEGAGLVTAKDIQQDSEVEFINPDAPICTLEEGASFSMDIYVEQGAGYASMERPRPAYLPVDALLVDAVFSPVLKVNYNVEAARVGQRTDYERLVLEIWTNGVHHPDNTLCEASRILKSYFGGIVEDIEKLNPEEADDQGAAAEDGEQEAAPETTPDEDDVMSRPVKDLGLSMRSENCLLRGGIHTVGELMGKTREELLKIRNLGKISLKEIEEKKEKLLNDIARQRGEPLPYEEAEGEPPKEETKRKKGEEESKEE